MVPGKKYAPEDFLRIAWRRRWVIVVPLVLSAVGTYLYSRSLPNVYQSQAVVLIIPQQIPEKYVRPTVDLTITARLDLMRQQILSRSRLEAIIDEFDLYREERRTMLRDQIVELMKRDINVVPQRVGRRESPNHFVVSYQSPSPRQAMQVTERISNLFIKEYAETRSVDTDATIQYLQRLTDDALRQLQEQEARLAEFRRVNAGRLPEEVGTGLQMIFNGRQQIQGLREGITKDRERQMALERQIADEIAAGSALPLPTSVSADPVAGPQPVAQQLARALEDLERLRLRLKDDHPDVQIARNRIKDLERKAEAEALRQPVTSATGAPAVTPADAARQKHLAQLRGELDRLGREIQDKNTSLQRAQIALAEQERRVQAAPGLQADLLELTRGYDGLRAQHAEMAGKLRNATLGSTLEQQQVSQQLRIVDPPRLPSSPRSPDRTRINLIGALSGLGLGLLIAGLLEYRDTSVRTDEDVLVALSLPVLALVPTLRTETRSRWRGLLPGASAGLIVAVLLAGLAWRADLLVGWGR